ncbi:MAG: hypothetical protein HC888_09385 [Candidatus Competibacteraceae bacterium]|nr:hypothetical protein [Candidatus Competibacteraceae bacterium]
MLILRGQIKLAQDGVGLLKGKRDALMQELITRARQLATMRDELFDRGRPPRRALSWRVPSAARQNCAPPPWRPAATWTSWSGRRRFGAWAWARSS